VFWLCSLQLFRTPCAWKEGYSTNLHGLGKTRPRVEFSTYQHRSGRTYYQTTGWSCNADDLKLRKDWHRTCCTERTHETTRET